MLHTQTLSFIFKPPFFCLHFLSHSFSFSIHLLTTSCSFYILSALPLPLFNIYHAICWCFCYVHHVSDYAWHPHVYSIHRPLTHTCLFFSLSLSVLSIISPPFLYGLSFHVVTFISPQSSHIHAGLLLCFFYFLLTLSPSLSARPSSLGWVGCVVCLAVRFLWAGWVRSG